MIKFNRAIQLIGLYGVLFLIPFIQQAINEYSSAEDDYKRKQTYFIVKHLYYDIKSLTCSQLGQQATTHDCKKGIYQDNQLNFALEQEKEAADRKSEILSIFWYVYMFCAFCAFIGTYVEYRKEYIKETAEQTH